MERVSVKSSAIVSIGYEPSTQVLEVEFPAKGDAPGDVWQYRPVDPNVFGSMLITGNSVGSIFHREVKTNPSIAATRLEEAA